MSEKMDGVRAYWNGEKLLSKHGKEIHCPKWFAEALPIGRKLDGELWMGRGSFDKLKSVLNSPLEQASSLWKEQMKFVLFDLVDGNLVYEQRMEKLHGLALPPFVSVVEVEECRGTDHLNVRVQSIVRENGEGVVLTKPKSLYVGERTRTRFKVKSVINSPPPIGSVISVKHNGYFANGTMRNAFFWRERPEVDWNPSHIELPFANWTVPENRAKLFDHLRQSLGYGKLEDFYLLSQQQIEKYGVDVLLDNVFQGSLSKALESAFPEHSWNPWLFQQSVSRGFWNDTKNQSSFMNWLGKRLGFKEMKDWYNLTQEDLKKNRGLGLLAKHNGSVTTLLRSVYPDHTWETDQLVNMICGNWNDAASVRTFMGWLGKRLGYKEIKDWYKLTVEDVKKNGGEGLLNKHDRSLSLLLRSVYPEHSWEIHKFGSVPKGYWKDASHQRAFLQGLGKQLGFKEMEDWYKLTTEDITTNGGASLLNMHGCSPSRLVRSVFSYHAWETHRFAVVPHGHWNDAANAREFADWLGKELGFKEMEDWYKLTTESVKRHGGGGLLKKYRNSPSLLVCSVYPEHEWHTEEFGAIL